MNAFENTPVSKSELLEILRQHAIADEFIAGQYWSDGKGCAVGCSLESFTTDVSNHSEYERLFGIPSVLAKLEDSLFESLPTEAAKAWPIQFIEAITPGSDLSLVWPKFAIWLMVGERYGAINYVPSNLDTGPILTVAGLYARLVNGDKPTKEDWMAARGAAAVASGAAAVAVNAALAAAFENANTNAADVSVAAYAAADAAAYAYGSTRFASDAILGAALGPDFADANDSAAFAATDAAFAAANAAANAAPCDYDAALDSARVAQSKKLRSLLAGA